MTRVELVQGRAPTSHPRPNILAFPAPSLARFGMLAVTLVVTGAFAGIWLHLELRRDAYVAYAAACRQEAKHAPIPLAELQATAQQIAAEDRCRAPVERERAGYMLCGILLAAGSGWALVLVTPLVLQRRDKLRKITGASAAIEWRIAHLAADLGVRQPVALRLGKSELSDAYTYGWPGDGRIALTRRLLETYTTDPRTFDVVMRHELAHLRHGDVEWSALARSAWYAAGTILAIPIVVAAAGWGRSLLPDYLYRVACLALVVHLVIRATLRAREHDADLAAGDGQWLLSLRTALRHARDPRRDPCYRRGPLALHPSPDERYAVLDQPELAASTTFTDAVVAGFLASTTVSLVFEIGWTALVGTAAQGAAQLGAALGSGLLLGAIMGLAIVRSVLVGHVVGRVPRLTPAAIGVGLGVAVGQVMGVAGTGVEHLAGLEQPLWLLISVGLATGATLLCGAVASLIAGYAGRTRSARAVWVPAVLAAVMVYTAAFWIAGQAQLLADGAGIQGLLAWAVTETAAPAVLLAGALLTVLSLIALAARGPAILPTWLITSQSAPDEAREAPGGLTALITGFAAGSIGAAVVAANRVLRGAAPTYEAHLQRIYAVIWIAGAAAAITTMVLSAMSASNGPALAAIAGPAAVGMVVYGLVALNVALGRVPSFGEVWLVASHALALGMALSLLAAGSALAGRRAGPRRPVGTSDVDTPAHVGATVSAAVVLTGVIAVCIAAFPAVVVSPLLLVA